MVAGRLAVITRALLLSHGAAGRRKASGAVPAGRSPVWAGSLRIRSPPPRARVTCAAVGLFRYAMADRIGPVWRAIQRRRGVPAHQLGVVLRWQRRRPI